MCITDLVGSIFHDVKLMEGMVCVVFISVELVAFDEN